MNVKKMSILCQLSLALILMSSCGLVKKASQGLSDQSSHSASDSLASSTDVSTSTSSEEPDNQSSNQSVISAQYELLLANYREQIGYLRQGQSLADNTDEYMYLMSIDAHADFYYALHDINGDGRSELLLSLEIPSSSSHKVFAIWTNPDLPEKVISVISVRNNIDVYADGTVANVFINPHEVRVEGQLNRFNSAGNQLIATGTFYIDSETKETHVEGEGILPDPQTIIQDQLEWQPLF